MERVKAKRIKGSESIRDLVEKGYRAFLLEHKDYYTEILSATHLCDNLIVIFLKGEHDIDELYNLIGDLVGFQNTLSKEDVTVHQTMSSGIYQWPENHGKKLLLCFPECDEDPGNFIHVDTCALYDYEELKSHHIFDERDSDEISLLQKNYKNASRKNKLIGVYSNEDNFPSKQQQKRLYTKKADFIFES